LNSFLKLGKTLVYNNKFALPGKGQGQIDPCSFGFGIREIPMLEILNGIINPIQPQTGNPYINKFFYLTTYTLDHSNTVKNPWPFPGISADTHGHFHTISSNHTRSLT
jgi:hypothetical protein